MEALEHLGSLRVSSYPAKWSSTMTSLKILSTTAALALLVAAPSASFAQQGHRGGHAAGGGAVAANDAYAYYGGPGYYDSYYDDGYADEGAVAEVPVPVGGDASYCAQRYRSYDPASGTYLGFDGLRHPCP